MLGGEEYDGDPKDLYIKVLATDLAGNTKECIYRYKIAPESDRPKIRFTNISFTDTTDENDTVMSGSAPVWLKSDKLYLNVSDDDGISKFEYKIGNSGYTECNLSGGSFALDITGQGDMQIYFRITDSEGGVFESSNAEVYTAPILQDGSAESVELSNVSVLNLKVDTSSPDVSGFKYSVSETRNGTEDTWSEPSEGFTVGKFGGKSYRYVRFQADATDENGIKEVNFYIGDDSYEGEFVLSGNPINDGIHNGRYVSDPIDLRGLNTTTYDVKVVVQDNAGTSKDRTSVIKVDNTAPVITIEDPGTVVAASSVYGDIDEKDTSVYYIVTITGTADEDLPSMDDPASFASIENPPAYATSKYVSVEDASLTYRIWFDGNTADRGENDKTAHSELLKDYLITEVNKGGLAIVTQADLDAGRIDPTYNVDIHIIAIDACGNVGHAKRTLAVDPKGDKPTVSISNPRLDWVTDDQGERISKVQTLGGEITILGTATDLHGSKDEVNNVSKAGVSGVGIMIDVVKNDGTRGLDGSWNYADISKLNTMLPECTWIEFDSTEDGGFKEVAFSTIPTDGSGQVYWKYAVKADFTGVAFTLRLNGNKKFDPTGADGDKVREYTVWAVAADKDGKPGSSLTPNVNFKVDSDRPILDNAKLTGRTDLTMHREYVYGMSVRGAWYYEADIHDDNGISEIKVDGTPVVSGGNIVTGALTNVTLSSITDGFHIKVAVGKNDNATVCTDSFNISYWENKSENPLDGSTSVSINIDNKPPVSIDSDAEGYNIETNVKNTGRFYTFGSKATEATVNGFNQTGVKRVAFYFTRDISGADGYSRIYDPMIPVGKVGNYFSDYKTGLTEMDGLYWVKYTAASAVSSGSTVNLTSIGTNIHVGGLAKIGGVIYRIDDFNGNTLTLEDNVSVTLNEDVYIAVCNVVDNTIQEGDGSAVGEDGYWVSPALDDGDRMIEVLRKQGDTWTWEANINSKCIGDGTATLHYLVFDEAGNIASKTVDIFIANNRPRIAGMKFATDDNANGTYEERETIKLYSAVAEGGTRNKNQAASSLAVTLLFLGSLPVAVDAGYP